MEIYSNSELLDRVTDELQRAVTTRDLAKDDADSLPFQFNLRPVMSSPLLQSIYAEVLRMRVSLMHNRSPIRGHYKLGPFTLRQRGLVCVSTDLASNDSKAWGPERTKRPLSEFWAERFLVKQRGEDGVETVRFSTEGLDGAWIPYGGGSLMCPGRHLSKQEMIGGVAAFSAYFDMEVLEGIPRMDDSFFGLGAQPPKEAVPVRIRRKAGLRST